MSAGIDPGPACPASPRSRLPRERGDRPVYFPKALDALGIESIDKLDAQWVEDHLGFPVSAGIDP